MRLGERMPHLPMPAATAATAGLLLAAAVPSLAVTLAAVAEQAPSFSEGGSAIGHAYEGMRGSASLALADASVRGRVLLDSQDRGSGGSGPAVAVLIVLFVVLPILGGVLGCCGCYYCYRNDMCCFEGQGRRKKAEQPAAVAVYYEDAAQQPLGMGMGTPAPIQVPPPASFSQQHVAAQQAPQEWYPAGQEYGGPRAGHIPSDPHAVPPPPPQPYSANQAPTHFATQGSRPNTAASLFGTNTSASNPQSTAYTSHQAQSTYQTDTFGPQTATVDPVKLSSMQPRERLVYELEAAASAEPPETFCGRYILLAEQAGGTQGVINFARSAHGGVEQYAIKFFVKGLPEYEEEVGLYERAELRNLLPELLMHSDNADGSQCSRSGYPWPPFMVVERGVTLTDWLTNAKMHRSYPEILHMFQQVSALLDGLHKAGFVHRDIKPENTLYLINSSVWKLLDVGIVKPVGEEAFAACTPLYAPPEVLSVHATKTNSRTVTVDTAHDIWALGVMVFQCICNKPHGWHDRSKDLYKLALGEQQYPWEAPNEEQPRVWRQSSLRKIVAKCVHRDPRQRLSAKEILQEIKQIGLSHTWAASGQGTTHS